ncbi:Hypp2408 [Branchiostoma lanceolatum]|uniref:Hypp2408 protein n=1 Tax=Branchiostoma lanceolatum TaxID=7740 RepID=A0A8J9ZQE0_BRALA|nr:Hypp2408 [Branchiostoma lanceolatum]
MWRQKGKSKPPLVDLAATSDLDQLISSHMTEPVKMSGNTFDPPASDSRNNTPGAVQEMLYKVLVIGEFGVGK